MITPDAPLLVVPGYGNSGPDHWQSHLERSRPGARRVIQAHWERPIRRSWVNALERAVAEAGAPPVLVGHSMGATTIVHWAARSRRRAAGALLVAPPDVEARLPGMPPPWVLRLVGWAPIPGGPLPFRSILVASSDDAMCSPARAREFATAWGSRLVELRQAGHVNSESGYGPWPAAEELIAALTAI